MFIRKLSVPLAVSAALMGTTAMADVTAQQVWDDWKANLAMYGDEGITIGSEVAEGGTVTVTDIAIAVDDGEVAMTANMGNITFTENGDGTVSVSMTEEYPMVMTIDDWEGNPSTTVGLMLRQTGMTMTVSGTAEELTYDMAVDRYAIELTEFTDFGETFPMTAFFALNNLTGTYTSRPGEVREMDYSIAASTVDALFDVQIPEERVSVNIAGQIADLTLAADMAFPESLMNLNVAPEDISLVGLAMAGGYTFSGLAYSADIDVEGDQLQGTATAGNGTLDFVFNETVVSYDSQLNGLVVSAPVIPDFPFPVEVGVEQYGIGFEMPLGRTDDPAAVRTSLNLTGLTINDDIWGLVDPAQQLGREPITAQIALSGQMKWLFDLLDPAQQMEMAMSAMPAELYGLTIDALQINALGAEVTGDGAFTFDNGDLMTFGGVPRPEGQASLVVTGANQLMDTLVSMGLIAEEELMAPRMMMGMFATATGNDQLSTTLEVRPDGSVFVNGQQVM